MGKRVIVVDVAALTELDAEMVDALARLQLTARRLGCSIRLRHVSSELQELLDLMGLGDVVSPCGRLRLWPRRQPEEREQSLGVEEEGHPADPTA